MAVDIKHQGVMPYAVPEADAAFVWGALPVTGFELAVAPALTSAVAPSHKYVDIVYDRAVKHVSAGNSDDALNPSNYNFSVVSGASITAISVEYKTGTSDQEFRILTDAQTDGATYTVNVDNVESTGNQPIAPPNDEATFSGGLLMARGVPAVTKGTITAGANRRYQAIKTLENFLVSYLSNGEPAWEVAEVRDASLSTYDVVLHSVGDRSLGTGANKGDTDIWARLYISSSSIVNTAYSDYNPATSTGNRGTSGTNTRFSFSDDTEFDYWIVCNEYEAVMVLSQGGSWDMIHFGKCINGIEDSKISGTARITTETVGTGTVVIDIDRDITANITVGQKIWLHNQTEDGAVSLAADQIEIVDVDAVTASTITVSGVSNAGYKPGSLVGLYSGYIFAFAYVNLWRFYYQWVARNNATGPYNFAYPDIPANLTESAQDPDNSGVYRMYSVVFNFSSSNGSPGRPELTIASPLGTQQGGDRMLLGGDPTKAYWVFPALDCSGLILCIGPGATA